MVFSLPLTGKQIINIFVCVWFFCVFNKNKSVLSLSLSTATRKHNMVGRKYFKGEGANERLGWQKYKINNNSKNFRGAP